MGLQVSPVVEADFDILATYIEEPLGNLTAPILPIAWPANTPEEVNARNKWSIDQQRLQFQDDETATFVKCVDDETGEVLSIARWHYYPQGFPWDHGAWRELDNTSPGDVKGTNLPPQIHKELFCKMLIETLKLRKTGSPCWTLTTLITRKGFRRRGAGSKLVMWGVEKANKDGVPAYIEALPAGLSTYTKLGFKPDYDIIIDMSEFGFKDPVVMTGLKKEPSA